MDAELLYFAGCPNWRLARERLTEALRIAGHPGRQITLTAVETDEEAQTLRFPGSPTIRLNGRDPFPSPDRTHGMSCRVYATPEGLDGAPTVDQLVQAITDVS
ncbi:DF family (seleno)protein [Allosalinactinospora lopnorensis]|uniref:DF family (seleno)protein n=1 Tax=Allosalinactinospora lopnorensis TaxID=1352348 RepID=UPI000623C21E|nr:alkylmercury lyase [Allosalinactinospora lopnorensis]